MVGVGVGEEEAAPRSMAGADGGAGTEPRPNAGATAPAKVFLSNRLRAFSTAPPFSTTPSRIKFVTRLSFVLAEDIQERTVGSTRSAWRQRSGM